jgi:addiction module RelE/StbE family toxin
MHIRWTPPAVADLENISDYLREHHPQFRQRTLRKLYDKIRTLKAAPYVGRLGQVEGTRELLFAPLPYIAVYRINGDAIEVWRIYHAAQNRP